MKQRLRPGGWLAPWYQSIPWEPLIKRKMVFILILPVRTWSGQIIHLLTRRLCKLYPHITQKSHVERKHESDCRSFEASSLPFAFLISPAWAFALSIIQEIYCKCFVDIISFSVIIYSWKPHIHKIKLQCSCSLRPLWSLFHGLLLLSLPSLSAPSRTVSAASRSPEPPADPAAASRPLLQDSQPAARVWGWVERPIGEFSNKNIWDSGEKGCECLYTNNLFFLSRCYREDNMMQTALGIRGWSHEERECSW